MQVHESRTLNDRRPRRAAVWGAASALSIAWLGYSLLQPNMMTTYRLKNGEIIGTMTWASNCLAVREALVAGAGRVFVSPPWTGGEMFEVEKVACGREDLAGFGDMQTNGGAE